VGCRFGADNVSWINDVDSGGDLFVAGAWLAVLGGGFGLIALVGVYDTLRHAGQLMILAPVLAIVGLTLVTISHLIPIALAKELVPGYGAASASTKDSLTVTSNTLAQISLVINYAGDVLLWGIVVPMYAWAILRTRVIADPQHRPARRHPSHPTGPGRTRRTARAAGRTRWSPPAGQRPAMNPHSLAPSQRIALVAVLASATLLLASATTAIGSANGVPASQVTVSVRPIGPNDLKPPECASLTLTALVTGATGTNAADLQLGTPAADNLNGKAGNDCIIGGAGDDTINGGGGTDICIGGPGTDTFTNCATSYQ
jgi:hypothetical protein